jgi:tyrosine-protein kinase Etk/Wzc
MSNPEEIKPVNVQAERTIDLNRVLQILIRRWYIIAGFVIGSLIIAYVQLRYTKPLYTASVFIKFDDDKGGQVSDLFRYGRLSGRIENQLKTEAEIFKSRTLAMATLKYLHHDISYFQQGQIVTSELYPFNYFNVIPLYLDSSDVGTSFIIKFISDSKFTIKTSQKAPEKTHQVNDSIILGSSIIKLQTKGGYFLSPVMGKEIMVRFNNLFTYASSLASAINVDLEKGTSILKLTYVSDLPDKAADFVNATAKVYILESVNTRARAAEQTVSFIDGLISDLAGQVNSAQQNLTDFQTSNSGVKLDDIGKAEFEKLTELEAQKSMLALRKLMTKNLADQINSSKNQKIELVLFDPEDANQLPDMLQLLNGLILERLSFSQKSLPTSPIMIENEKKIAEVKLALTRAIKSAQLKLDDRIAFIQNQIKATSATLMNLPQKQQALLNLERNFKVNEKIYGYLMEKKLETRISKSSIIANASIIDEAWAPKTAFFPTPSKTYSIAFSVGLGLGIGFIFLLRFIYNRIPDKETIEALSTTPVIGVIKRLDSEEMEDNYELYVMKSPKSIFSESVRGIRTNINFLLKGETHKVVCVTSSVSGEGKTFCTVNLAASLTLLGYKVVIVGCDLRRPKIHLTFRKMSNDIGLTTCLIGKHSLKEVTMPTEFENLDIIPAGPTPPNPSELLQSTLMTNIIEELKAEYDYVFFDTAPVGLVSDSFALMSKADINLFIIRAQYSKRDFALIPDRLLQDNLIPNIYTILNSYDNSSAVYSSIYKSVYGGYYGGGGYYYYGGYYNRGYGYYNKKYYSQYYSGYYSDDPTPKTLLQKFLSNFKKRKKA